MVGGHDRGGNDGIGAERRSLLRGAGAVVVAGGLAGCSGLRNIERTYEATPVSLTGSATGELGFRLVDKREIVTERQREVADAITVDATVVSHLRWYNRPEAGQIVFLSTPSVGFLGQEFNPLVKNSLVEFVRQRPDLLATMCGCPVGEREVETADSLVGTNPGSSIALVDGVTTGGDVDAAAFGETIPGTDIVGALTTGPYGREYWAAYTVLAAKLTHGDDTVVPTWVEAKIIGGRGRRGGNSGDGGGSDQIEISGESRAGPRGGGVVTEGDLAGSKSDFERLLEEGVVEIDPERITTGTATPTTGTTPPDTTTPQPDPDRDPLDFEFDSLPELQEAEWDIRESPDTLGTETTGRAKSVVIGDGRNTVTLLGSTGSTQSGNVNPVWDADLGALLRTDLFYYTDRDGTVTRLPDWDLPPGRLVAWNGSGWAPPPAEWNGSEWSPVLAERNGSEWSPLNVTVDGFLGLANAGDGTVDAVVAAASRVTRTFDGRRVALVGANTRTHTLNVPAPEEGEPLPDRETVDDTAGTLAGVFRNLAASIPRMTATRTATGDDGGVDVTIGLGPSSESTTDFSVDLDAADVDVESATIELETEQSVVDKYDTNGQSGIQGEEVRDAISCFLFGNNCRPIEGPDARQLTAEEVRKVISEFLFGDS